MKITNDLIVFDLEATSNKETEDHQPEKQTNNFITDIGAVLLNKDLEIVSEFQSLVRPEEPITPYIEKITHISNEMVATADLWPTVSARFEEWVRANVKNIKNVRLCPWGSYFDMPLIRRCYEFYNMKFPFSGTAFDIKTIAFAWCALSGRRNDKLSVEHVAELMGIKPEGQYHRGLTDAKAEAAILKRAMKDLGSGYFLNMEDNQPYRHISISRTKAKN